MPKELTKQKKKTENAVKLYCKVRDNYICQHCGKVLKKNNCHGSHVIPVSAGNQFRFDPVNIKTLCFHCHINWWHKNPVESGEWFKKKFPERHKYLFGKPRETVKFTVDELKEIEKKYKNLI